VGKVRVLLQFTPNRETVYASDANISESYSREADSQGGTRESRNTQKQEKTIIITDKAGVDRPLVLRETAPKIAGVVIIAEGGDSVFVKDALTKAATTVLGIEANKVQVLKMKGQ
jgi:stage III sporulation protein AG